MTVRSLTALSLAVAALAFTLRLVPVLRGGGLQGVLGYDDGVYYSAANALLSGRLPYRDYLLLHPPGIIAVLAPFAALGRLLSDSTGLALARLAFMGVGALNAVLALHIGRRISLTAGLTAGLFYATVHASMYAERSTYLEPLVNLGVLTAVWWVGGAARDSGAEPGWASGPRARPVLAGVALGLAAATKLWVAGPALVIAIWLLRRHGRGAVASFVGGAVAAGASVCLPFLIAAPKAFVRLVLLDQLTRPHKVALTDRLQSLTGTSLLGPWADPAPSSLLIAVAAIVVAVVAVAVWVAVVEPRARLWVALLSVLVVDVVSTPAYFPHYATHVMPGVALVLGAGVHLARTKPALAPRALRVAPLLGLTVLLAAMVVAVVGQPEGRRLPVQARQAAAASSGCVAADDISLLVAADALTRDLERGCPLVVDVSGAVLDARMPGPHPHRYYRRQVSAYLAAGDVLLLRSEHMDRLDAAARREIGAMPVVLRQASLTVRVRGGGGGAATAAPRR